MATYQRFILLSILLLSSSAAYCYEANADNEASNCECTVDQPVERSSFPDGFVFGAAGSSYQFEGAYDKDGKGLSNWDYYTHTHPEKIADGDVAVNSYLQYKEDVRLAKENGIRCIPVLNLMAKATTKEDFRYYTDVCFKHFGDRVKHWITLNEPWTFTNHGYSIGTFAPGCCFDRTTSCSDGNSDTEPYIVTHHQLLAHAAAAQLYKQKYQAHQKGSIGITLNSNWFVPCSNSTADQMAQQHAMDFGLGWFLDPLVFGTYPESMRRLVSSRFPTFTPSESRMVKGSFDFLGLNHYPSYYATDAPHDPNEGPFSYNTDYLMTFIGLRDGIPMANRQTDVEWLFIYPKGLRRLLEYIRRTYNDPAIVITENGECEADISTNKLEDALNDTVRIDYTHDHLCFLLNAIKVGGQIKGYFAWSLLDNYEWSSGYTVRFGLHYVDYKNNLLRYPKKSATWLKNFHSRDSTVLNKNIRSVGEDNSTLSSL